MAELARGDMNALGELVRRHQSAALSTAYRILGRWDAAEDVVQETFIRVHRAARGYEPSAAFSTWLYRIVVNLCRDALRKRRSQVEPPTDLRDGRAAAPPSSLEERERARAVRQAVDRLPERQRIAVILHRYAGLSHAEIAETTGSTVSAVESCLVRAYAGLREALKGLRES
ncbi:MAG: sigma-70 family RNA polymerase sigma factor [Phycisphaerae bacterium]|nr:sigma-70 family RNA polymerase sigma factor [Phycisphaerae bacterium]